MTEFSCHAQMRALERFGERLTLPELRAMEREIREGRAPRVKKPKLDPHCFAYLASWPRMGRAVTVVFSHETNRIVTVLASPAADVRVNARAKRKSPRDFREYEPDDDAGIDDGVSFAAYDEAPASFATLREAFPASLGGGR